MGLKRDLARVISANLIKFLIGVVNGFLIPAFLSLDQYAYLKSFTLYVGYVGILHLGFNDGIYLKYGGETKNRIILPALKYEHDFLLRFQLAVTMFFVVLGFLRKDFIVIAFAMTILPTNLQVFFDFFYQAIGEFSVYSKIKVFHPLIQLALNLTVIFIFKLNNYLPFVLSYLVSLYLSYFVYELLFRRNFKPTNIQPYKNPSEIRNLFKVGIFIMLGNLSTILIYSLDRWFVKLWLTVESFAYYSFAVSLMAIVNLVISSVAMTFYPYLSRGYTEKLLNKLKNYFIIVGSVSSISYFILSLIVTVFIPKYDQSLDIISILFAGFPAITVINALYLNLYKANKMERRYLSVAFKILLLSFVLNTFALLIKHNSQAIAIATTATLYIWFFYSSRDFKELQATWKERMFLITYLLLFFASTMIKILALGVAVFGLGVFMLILVIYRTEFFELVNKFFKK
jgi:O-antigen/teichoic acid export membrane protein